MTITKLYRCKNIIASPNYHRDRAIQMGELMGAWIAELSLSKMHSKEYHSALNKRNMYSQRLVWYINKYRKNNYNEWCDYES